MHRHGRNIFVQHDCEHGPEMEEDSLNTASTFVKCTLDRSLFPSRAGRLSRARNYSQFRVNESKTIRIAAQTRAPEQERKRRGNTRGEHSKTRARKGKKHGREGRARERERERTRSRWTFILRHPGPMSSFRFVPLPPSPLSPFPSLQRVDPILEVRRAS